ncbi:MAG: carboxymuconolactone decarboxylase family protein [candidate division Zixibacteria bacterium]|nr:carboxymuconolactone decarboxylase family protein [candidate division Zixibacteria bacterium]MBU1470696.1 carboxymuconolactone decarboxylase family protein [candidate division Zixibacteria bacterium]MBU2624998.1 carboxymuconolactone decarboxylase family protein [candidate division Zixibacteria bacterium]
MNDRESEADPEAASERAREFREQRELLNKIVLDNSGLTMKRFFNLDTQAYTDGALSTKTKELLGLVSSLVLRCDDCTMYHLLRCFEKGVSDQEFEETMSIGLVVGGSITIPHIRRAFKAWVELRRGKGE